MHAATVVSFAVSALLAHASVQSPAQDPKPVAPSAHERAVLQLQQLAWLAGTWTLQDGATTTEEHWRPLQGTSMLGTSHTFDARTRFFEFLRLAVDRDRVVYTAMPRGNTPTQFVLTKLAEGEVEFENAAHDHPQRIRYQKTAAGVTATIGQLDGSRAAKFEFTAR